MSTAATSARISPYPVPGFKSWVYNMPNRGQMAFQHTGVYYASAFREASKRTTLLALKRNAEAAERQFSERRQTLLTAHAALQQPAAASVVRHCAALNSVALVDVSSPLVGDLVTAGRLNRLNYANLLDSLQGEDTVHMLRHSETDFDTLEALKRAADWSGNGRAREASYLMDACDRTLSGGASVEHFNGLMATYNTCGFHEASRVHQQVYDAMGVRGVNPTARTYHLVMQSLCLTGNPKEAESIFAYLRHHHVESVTSDMYDTMMMGYTFERDYGKVDELWTEMVTRQAPKPTATTLDVYLRSIVQLANSALSQAHKQHPSQMPNVVELKRIPGILHVAYSLGVPYAHVSPAMKLEINDALRKFQISKDRFYDWGRSVKQFGFLDWRRKHNAHANLEELTPTVLHDRSGFVGPLTTPVSQESMPAYMSDRNAWESMPLMDEMNDVSIEEANKRGRERYSRNAAPLHDRPASWMSDVPETRYDKMYGLANPNLAKLGVRRQLLGDSPNKQDMEQRDRSILARTLSGARRVRQSVERSRTHRSEK